MRQFLGIIASLFFIFAIYRDSIYVPFDHVIRTSFHPECSEAYISMLIHPYVSRLSLTYQTRFNWPYFSHRWSTTKLFAVRAH